ncbi:MAG TPA: GAF domain-containing protein [Bdellovibrionota bacterium]|jgi:GAF domain-containing protein
MIQELRSEVHTAEDYRTRLPELEAYLVGNWLTDFANFSSFVFHSVPRLNWAGFYLFDGTCLRLGPFVGKPACTEIRPGRGVCGTAFSSKEPQLVPDVEKFAGHITCDTASRSELVLPLMAGSECVGVFDMDSPDLDRFRESDRDGMDLWLKSLCSRLTSDGLAAKPWKPRA